MGLIDGLIKGALALAFGLALGACTLKHRVEVVMVTEAAHACYREEPCPGDWVELKAGGCALFVVNEDGCPAGSTEVRGE